MDIRLLTQGDESALIAAARIFNDLELTRERAREILLDPTFLMVVVTNDTGQLASRAYAHVL
ncbi:MAG: hypothetical protein JOZ55_00290, partial [Alphaproteobacteria bacterium]|nr:hypothetical protein [Alphaproteobacteria bacterium]